MRTPRAGACVRVVALAVPRFGLIAGALIAAPVLAQQTAPSQAPVPVPPNLPPMALPSREQVTPPKPAPAPNSSVSIDSQNAIRPAPCPLTGSTATLALTSVRFTGPNGAPLAPEIAALLADIRPKGTGQQPVSVVCDVRDEANAALRHAGYIASAQIPPQSITTGELELQIVTGHIVEVHVHGNAGAHAAALLGRIEQLKRLNPLNEHEAERILLIASDIPGLDVQLSLRPAGTAPGELIGDLTVVTRRFAILGNFQNYGSNELGRETGYVRAEGYGLLTPTDILYAGVSSTGDFKEQQIAQTGYTTGVGGGGTTIGGRFTYAWSRPALGALDLRSRSLIGGIDLLQPIVRTVNGNLYLGGGAELIEQRTRVFSNGGGSSPLNRDKLRILFARASGNYALRRIDGSTIATISGAIEVRKGLDILSASKTGADSGGYLPSRFEGDPQAWVIRGNLDGTLSKGPFTVAGGLRSQWANHPLLNYEEFAIGNLSIGRGYDPGANSGDRAVGVTGELRFNLATFKRVPIQLFGFHDAVWIWNLDTNSTENDREFRSYGGGIRFTLPNHLLLEGTYAHPRDKALSFDKHAPPDRFLVSLTVQFTPAGQR